MKRTVYIETSVVSYFTGRRSPNRIVAGHQQSTKVFWQLLNKSLSPHVSALVIQEAEKGNTAGACARLDAIASFPALRITREAELLAQSILEECGIPVEYPEDALHIAVASVSGMDLIVTWNFSHINNPFTKQKIRRAVELAGYECPEIVSPDAFLGDET